LLLVCTGHPFTVMEKLKIDFAKEISELLVSFKGTRERDKIKLIIHAGTPKTGTTSLQTYLGKKQFKLRGEGILYPHNLNKLQHPTAPKHQWFEKNLLSNQLEYFLENFKNIIAQIKKDTHTIILSSEGIYNYWWDFSEQAKNTLSALTTLFDVNIWIWFREPLGFIESYYKQCIRNPQLDNNLCYGKDLSFSEMLQIEWFARHLNYRGFVTDCELIFGENKVSVFKYENDVVQALIQTLGFATPYDNQTPFQNKSLNSASIQLLRTLNRYNLKPKQKDSIIPHLREIDKVLDNYKSESLIDDESQKRVLALYKPVTDQSVRCV
jgi:hypothetical protein